MVNTMVTGFNFTTSRPAVRRRNSHSVETPLENVKIKTEDVDDGWSPASSTSCALFGGTSDDPILLDDDIKIKQEDDDGWEPASSRPYTQFGNVKDNPIVLDDQDDQDDRDRDSKSRDESEEDEVEADDFVDHDASNAEDANNSNDCEDSGGSEGSEDNDFQIKQEDGDDDIIMTDAWEGHGLSKGDPIVLDDEEEEEEGLRQGARFSNFRPARFESVSPSEPDVPNELPRDPKHVLSQSPSVLPSSSWPDDPNETPWDSRHFLSRSPSLVIGDSALPSIEMPSALHQNQKTDYFDKTFEGPKDDASEVFDEPDVDVDRYSDNEKGDKEHDEEDGEEDDTGNAGPINYDDDMHGSMSPSKIEGRLDPPANPFATNPFEQDESNQMDKKEPEEATCDDFLQTLSCLVQDQRRSPVKSSSRESGEEGTATNYVPEHLRAQHQANTTRPFLNMGPSSHGSGEEEANEATDDFPAHLQPQQQASMTTPSLDVESRVDGGDENALAASAFADFERGYNAKKEAGTNSMEDDIEFMRYRSQEQARRKRVVEEARALPSPSPEPFENEDDAYGDCNGGPRYNSDLELLCGPPQPRRNLKRHAEDEEPQEEGEEGEEEEEEEEEEEIMDQEAQPVLNDNDTDLKSKRGRKRVKKADDQNASNPAPKKRGRPAGVRNGEGKGKKTAPTKRKGKNTDAVSGGRLLDAGSFLTANAIRDANANEADPATYHKAGQEVTKVKHQALKRLLATVPLDQKKTAQMDKKDLLEATKKFAGKGTCRADGLGDWLVNGMKSALKNYQVLGAGFMRERERGVDDPKGGICADTMGFGKTVMTLANCVNDTLFRKRVNEEGPRTTLIVVPSTLVAQWRSEIEKHVKVKENKIKVMTYRSGSRIDSNDDSEMLSSYDFVITTYYEVMNSFPKGEPPVELQTRKEKDEWWSKFYEKKKGLLHRVDFRRIVLDEAQQIKNYKGRTSIACRLIKAELKWALSGTPIVNGPLELYAYFKFLDVPSTGSFKVFRANYYGDDDPEKLRRLEVMLQKFTIRRTHKDKMFGQPILKLPKAGEYTHECKFNDIERAVYEIVRKRMIARINAFSRDNTLQRNYSNVLVMLLRLRQMTSNLILVETVMRDLLEREDLEKLARLTQADAHADEQRQSQLVALRRMLSQNSVENQDDPSSSSSQGGGTQRHDLPERDDLVETGNMHGLTYNFKKYLATLRQGKAWEELQARTLCAECRQPPEDPVVTSCYHIFCQPCLETLQHHAALQGVQHARCSACQTEYSRADLCGAYDLVSVVQAEEFESDTEAGPSSRHWKKKQKGQKKAQETKSDEEVVESWINMNGSVLPSAKTIAIKAQIMNWLEADPNCKIIIYTQFITMIRILGKMCDQEGFGYVAFHGKQTLAARDATIEQFRDDREAKIMLASLKCGGVGLNLTMASHVISCEPWWNASCEMQAFGRVFRIGQTETCSFTKLIVSNSIDERLIAMQKRKQAQIDSVMGDENVDGKKLSMIELMQLFGNVKEDGSGRPFIVVENQQTIPRFNQDSEDEGDDE